MSATDGGRSGWRGFAVAALALAGLLFSLTPAAERLDALVLDLQWQALRKFAPRPAPDDIVIVGLDDAAYASITEPRALWHEPLARALVRVASAGPRAVGLDVALPERSFDTIRAGLDRTLMVGLAAARERAPVVAALSIDMRTRAARPIHAPFLAVLGDQGLGVGILARDADGVTRRFTLSLPTEDGTFPTFDGRLCRALSRTCGEGLVHYALGRPFLHVSLKRLLETPDGPWLERTFRDRIVLFGETQPYSDRIDVPVSYAGWERDVADAPGVVVHAQALRTALLDAAPEEASRPLLALLIAAAGLFFLLRDWRLAGVAVGLAVAFAFVAAAAALRAGLYVPLGSALVTLGLAFLARLAIRVRFRAESVSGAGSKVA